MISGRSGMGTSRHRKVPRHKISALNAFTRAEIERCYGAVRLRPMTTWFASIRELFVATMRV